MKLFTFATPFILLFLGSIITTTPATVIALANDDVNNNVGVIAALRGHSYGRIERTPPGSSVCTYAPNYGCYPNTPTPGWPRCCNNKDTCAKEYGAGTTPPCQTKACAGTTDPPVAGSWCLHAKQVCCSSSKKISHFTSFCTYYGFKQPRFVATFEEEEMMMMYDEGMITADEFSIDCLTCGNEKCA